MCMYAWWLVYYYTLYIVWASFQLFGNEFPVCGSEWFLVYLLTTDDFTFKTCLDGDWFSILQLAD